MNRTGRSNLRTLYQCLAVLLVLGMLITGADVSVLADAGAVGDAPQDSGVQEGSTFPEETAESMETGADEMEPPDDDGDSMGEDPGQLAEDTEMPSPTVAPSQEPEPQESEELPDDGIVTAEPDEVVVQTAEQFEQALAHEAERFVVVLDADLDLGVLSAPLSVLRGSQVTLDLSGHHIAVCGIVSEDGTKPASLFDIQGTITIRDDTGNGAIAARNAQNIFIIHDEGNLTLAEKAALVVGEDCTRAVLCDAQSTFKMVGGSIENVLQEEEMPVPEQDGGAVLLRGEGARMDFTGGVIRGTYAKNGGGVAVLAGASLTMTDPTQVAPEAEISACKAVDNGGAIYIEKGAQALIGGGNLHDNESQYGGAVWCAGGLYTDAPEDAPLRITQNMAEQEGGGLWIAAEADVSLAGYAQVAGNTGAQVPQDIWPGDTPHAETFEIAVKPSPPVEEPSEEPTPSPEPTEEPTPEPEEGEPAEEPSEENSPVPVPTEEPSTSEDEKTDTPEELRAALERGGTVLLEGDILFDESVEGTLLTVPSGSKVLLILNGYSMEAAGNAGTDMICVEGDLTIQSSKGTDTETKNSSVFFGGAGNMFHVSAGGRLSIKDLELHIGEDSQRAVLVESGGTLIMQGSRIDGAGTAVYGGAVCLAGDAQGHVSTRAVLENTSIQGTHATYGGAVSIQNADLDMLAGSCINNAQASGSTGARTSSGLGGGVYLESGTLTISDSALNSCMAASSGGGIFVESGTMTMESGSIANCEAQTGYGGGIAAETGTVVLNGGLIEDCTAFGDGGGVYVGQQAVLQTEAAADAPVTVRNNTALEGSGGGIALAFGAQADLQGFAELNGNTASGAPSDIYSVSTVYMPATFTAAAVNDSVLLDDESAAQAAYVTMKEALERGENYTLDQSIAVHIPFDWNGTSIAGITISGATELDLNGFELSAIGPDTYVANGLSLITVNGSFTIKDSSAAQNGSIFYDHGDNILSIGANGTAELKSGTLKIGETASRAVFARNAFIMSGGAITGAGALKDNSTPTQYAKHGGAVRGFANATQASTITINGGIIEGTRANCGGALYIQGNLHMSGGTITECTAEDVVLETSNSGQTQSRAKGGAVWIDSVGSPSVVIDGGTLTECTSEQYDSNLDGGALICVSSGTLNVRIPSGETFNWGAGEFSKSQDNIKLTGASAGLCITGAGALNMTEGENLVNMSAGSLTIGDGTSPGPALNIDPGAIHAQRAVFMRGGALNVNSAVIEGRGVGTGDGGGIWVRGGSADLIDCSIRNTYGDHGGAIFVSDGAVLKMSGGSVENCESVYDGGGIHIAAGGKASFTGTTDITISGCKTGPNGHGGGTYFNAAVPAGAGTAGSLAADVADPGKLIVAKNQSGDFPGGGIYIDNYDSSSDADVVKLEGNASITGNLPDVVYRNLWPPYEAGKVNNISTFVLGENNGLPEGANSLLSDIQSQALSSAETSLVFEVGKVYTQTECSVFDPETLQNKDGVSIASLELKFVQGGQIKGGGIHLDGSGIGGLMMISGVSMTLSGSNGNDSLPELLADYDGQSDIIAVDGAGNGKLVVDGPTISGGMTMEEMDLLPRGSKAVVGVHVTGHGDANAYDFEMRSGIIQNCGKTFMFERNTNGTTTGDFIGSDGGGVFLEEGAKGHVTGTSLFTQNAALKGAAVYVLNSDLDVDGSPTFTSCGNSWTEFGGAIAIEQSGQLNIRGGVFTDNRARWGGAIAIVRKQNLASTQNSHSRPVPDQNVGTAPSASITGALIGVGQDFNPTAALAEETGTDIVTAMAEDQGNIATYGGGIYVDTIDVSVDASVNVTNTSIQSNSATHGGGIYICSGSVTLGDNAWVWRNGAVAGNSRPQREDQVQTGNYAHQWYGHGGGIYVGAGYQQVKDTGGGSWSLPEYQAQGRLILEGTARVERNSTTNQVNQLQSSWPGHGGGIYVASGANAGISGGTVTMKDASVVNANFAMGRGGGIFVASKGTLSFEGHEQPDRDNGSIEGIAVLYNRDSGSLETLGTALETRQDRIVRNVDFDSGAILLPESTTTVDENNETTWYDGWKNYVAAMSNAHQDPVLSVIFEEALANGNGEIDLAKYLPEFLNTSSTLYQKAILKYRSLYGNDVDAEGAVRWQVPNAQTLNVVGYVEIQPGEDVTLDLNGCLIDAGASVTGAMDLTDSSQNTVFRVLGETGTVPGAKFKVKDTQGNGRIIREEALLNNLIQVREGATLVLEGGTYTNKGAHVIKSEGGYITITGNTKILNSGNGIEPGGAVMMVGLPANDPQPTQGRLTLSGNALFQGNSGSFGGAIYSTAGEGTFIVSDNVQIDHNDGRCGGGIWVYNLTMTGGKVTNNNALWGGGRTGQGGGMFVSGDVMITGAIIDHNVAENTGGGIYVTWGTQATIEGSGLYAVQITNNRADDSMYDSLAETHNFAGGGIFLEHNLIDVDNKPGLDADRTVLRIYKAYITENSAAYAGGVGTCALGSAEVQNIDGPTICNNILINNPTLPAGAPEASDVVKRASQDILCDGAGEVGLVMIGPNGATEEETIEGAPKAEWFGQGVAIDKLEDYSSDKKYDDPKSINFDIADGPLTKYYARFGVKNETNSGTAIEEAEQNAQCLIQGNSSRTGAGGIGGNGTMILGRAAQRTPMTPVSWAFEKTIEVEDDYTFDEEDTFTFQLESRYPIQTTPEWKSVQAAQTEWYAVQTQVHPAALNLENGSAFVEMPMLSYSSPGTYSYVLAETASSADGIGADPTKYWIDVTVAPSSYEYDDYTEKEEPPLKVRAINVYSIVAENGQLKAGDYIGDFAINAQGNPITSSGNPLSFLNVQGVQYAPQIHKTVTGSTDDSLSFDFRIEAVSEDAPLPEQTSISAKADQTVSFERIVFYANQTLSSTDYIYRIFEVDGGAQNVTYDTNDWLLTVPVLREGSSLKLGEIEYKSSDGREKSGSAEFVNTVRPPGSTSTPSSEASESPSAEPSQPPDGSASPSAEPTPSFATETPLPSETPGMWPPHSPFPSGSGPWPSLPPGGPGTSTTFPPHPTPSGTAQESGTPTPSASKTALPSASPSPSAAEPQETETPSPTPTPSASVLPSSSVTPLPSASPTVSQSPSAGMSAESTPTATSSSLGYTNSPLIPGDIVPSSSPTGSNPAGNTGNSGAGNAVSSESPGAPTGSPKTDDPSHLGTWLLLLAAGTSVILGVILIGGRRKRKDQ